ncbi:acyl carrier protein [Streptomyces harbinensis]|uniref:acyl carrier protein n=1 Tax=Streptomyces harbinensis TaxID=1176198 RepID=UPI0034DFE2A8
MLAIPEDRFPRTPAGKIRRAALLERLLAGAFDPPDPRTVVAEEVSAVLGRPVTGAEDTPFYELGLDSVRMVRLRARLEQALERPVPQTALFEHPTVTALAAHLAGDAAHPGRKATAPAPDIGGPDADGAGTDGPGTPAPVSGVPAAWLCPAAASSTHRAANTAARRVLLGRLPELPMAGLILAPGSGIGEMCGRGEFRGAKIPPDHRGRRTRQPKGSPAVPPSGGE